MGRGIMPLAKSQVNPHDNKEQTFFLFFFAEEKTKLTASVYRSMFVSFHPLFIWMFYCECDAFLHNRRLQTVGFSSNAFPAVFFISLEYPGAAGRTVTVRFERGAGKSNIVLSRTDLTLWDMSTRSTFDNDNFQYCLGRHQSQSARDSFPLIARLSNIKWTHGGRGGGTSL